MNKAVLGVVLSLAAMGAAHAQNFDDGMKAELVAGCKVDLVKKLPGTTDPNLSKACDCLISHYQQTPDGGQIDWNAAVTGLKTGSVAAQNEQQGNGAMFASFYVVALKEPSVGVCLSK